MSWVSTLSSRQVAVLRIVFGLVWLVDAIFKWLPGFQNGFTDDVMMAAQGQPAWLGWWFNTPMNLFMQHSHFFAILVAILESLLAILLITGLGRRITYIAGMVVAFIVWGFGEGFGGPYGIDSTDIGAAVMYIFVFWALLLLDKAAAPAWALDGLIKRKSSPK